MAEDNAKSKFIKAKRVVALGGVILMGISLIATLVVAFLKFPGSQQVFLALVGCDVLIPMFIWTYMLLVKFAMTLDDKSSD